jgi:uncharacterized integral membrane protein (TIGR00698 family)
VAIGGLALAVVANLALPGVPLLTFCIVIGVVLGQLPAMQARLDGPLRPGLALASRRLLRIGIVLLGLKLGLADIAALGAPTLIAVVIVVLLTFFGTWLLGIAARLPGDEPLLVASGFAICGVSAIGAMAAVTRSKSSEIAVPAALVTLCGSLAIVVLPLLRAPLGLTDLQFGAWAGASVHDVGQVVAVAQTAGASALALAVAVKLTRVVLLAPLVFGVAVSRRVRARGLPQPGDTAAKPPIVPLFVLGFLAAMLVRTILPVPEIVLQAADIGQTVLFGLALVALGSSIRVASLVRTSGRSLAVGLASWVLIAGLAWAAVVITTG